MGLVKGRVGEALLLNLRLQSETAGLFPQVTITNDAGVTVTVIDMTDVGGGLYQAEWASPTLGQFEAGYLTYTDAAHTTRSKDLPGGDDILITDASADAGLVWDRQQADHVTDGSFGQAMALVAGHAGKNAVLDGGAGVPNVPHNGNNNLTTCRLRVFATAAEASAATLGAADGADGEILRSTFDSTNYVSGSLTAVPEVLANFVRTVST